MSKTTIIHRLNDLRVKKGESVIFDVFGTLLKPLKQKDPYRRLLVEAKTPFHKNIMTSTSTIGELAKVAGLDGEKYEEQMKEICSSLEPYEESLGCLRELSKRQIKWICCSNLTIDFVKDVCRVLELKEGEHVWSCEVGRIKPTKEIFDLACQRLNAEPTSVIMVGDSKGSDIDGANLAGLSHSFWIKREDRKI